MEHELFIPVSNMSLTLNDTCNKMMSYDNRDMA